MVRLARQRILLSGTIGLSMLFSGCGASTPASSTAGSGKGPTTPPASKHSAVAIAIPTAVNPCPMRNPYGAKVPLGKTITVSPYGHPQDSQVLITVSKAVLSDNAYNALVAYFKASDLQGLDKNGLWSVRRGALSLSGPPAGKTLLGIYGDGDIFMTSAADIPVWACDGQNNAYTIATTLTYNNNDSFFLWLFEVDKPTTSAGSYSLAINYDVGIDLGALSLTP